MPLPQQQSKARPFAPYTLPETLRVSPPPPTSPPSPAERAPSRPRRTLAERVEGRLRATELGQLVRFLPDAREARRRTGKSLIAQVRELVALARGEGRLAVEDYYQFELFDDALTPPGEKWRFVGKKRLNRTSRRANRPTWAGMVSDKLIASALYEGLGIPAPPIHAAYVHGRRSTGRVPQLSTPEEVAAFLRSKDTPYPLFGKPFFGLKGMGASLIDAYDRARDVLVLASGEVLPVEEYVRRWPHDQVTRLAREHPFYAGYLFQAKSLQHPELDALTGSRVAAFRLCILLTDAGPLLHRVTWKLPVGRSMTNHLVDGSGNIRCWVEPSSGRVLQSRRGPTTPDTPFAALGEFGTPIDAHPDTGRPLVDYVVPDWHRFVDECLRLSLTLPALRYQSWDVTMAPEGRPLLLEINTLGGAAQVPGGIGVLDETWLAFERSLKGLRGASSE